MHTVGYVLIAQNKHSDDGRLMYISILGCGLSEHCVLSVKRSYVVSQYTVSGPTIESSFHEILYQIIFPGTKLIMTDLGSR